MKKYRNWQSCGMALSKDMRNYQLILFFLLTSINIFSQVKNYTIDTIQVKSEILKESRSIIVYKSSSILSSDSVKFIYILDGEFSGYGFQRLKEQFKDSISNLIGIGIINTDKRRDLLYINSADKFLDFITSELIPIAEKDYKVKTRILYGHSFAGAFTVYSMINKPKYFDYFIASSPTPIMGLINKDNFQKIDSASRSKIFFYFSFGSKDLGQVRKWSQRLKDNLTGMKFTNLVWKFEILEGKTHFRSGIPALLNGLNDLQ